MTPSLIPIRAKPFYWRWFLQVQSTLGWVYQLMTSPLGPGSLLLPWHLELSRGSSHLLPTHCYIFLLIHLATWKPFLLLPKPEPFSLFNLPFSSPTYDSPSLWLQELFCSPLLSGIKASTLWTSLLLKFIWSMSCSMGILSFWNNINLSVSTYHVCPFGFGLLPSG